MDVAFMSLGARPGTGHDRVDHDGRGAAAAKSHGCPSPGKDELAAIARGHGMHLSEEDLGSFEPMVAGLLTSYDAVGELYTQTAPQPPAW
jgi:hypothetical protein